MNILRKIIDVIMPVSRREFDSCVADIIEVLNGMTLSSSQQAQMLSGLINQVSGLQTGTKEEKKEEVNDPSFQ